MSIKTDLHISVLREDLWWLAELEIDQRFIVFVQILDFFFFLDLDQKRNVGADFPERTEQEG